MATIAVEDAYPISPALRSRGAPPAPGAGPHVPRLTLGAVLLAFAAALAGALAPAARAGDDDILSLDKKFREVAKHAIPATVLVKSTLKDGSGRAGFGTGATISPDGYILTCSHVIDTAGEVEVTFADGESAPARVLSKNPRQDYALLKIERTGLPCFKIGDSRSLRLGQWVVALGHPGGPYPDLRPSFSVGKITGLHRRLPVQMMERNYDDAIRTDAPIFAGNSGGPLVTLEGDLVGLNGAILLINENSYAVPIHDVMANLDRMKKGEEIAGREGVAGGVAPIEEFEGKDLARFFGRAGRKLLGRDGLGKLIPGEGKERDEIARALERIGKSLEGERAQGMLESLLGAFGGDGQDGRRGGEPPGGDLDNLKKQMEKLFGGGGGGDGNGQGDGEMPGLPDLDGLRKQMEKLFGGGEPAPGAPGESETPGLDMEQLRKQIEGIFGGEGGDAGKALQDMLEKLGGGFGGDGNDDEEPAVPAPAPRRVQLGLSLAEDDPAAAGVRVADVDAKGPAASAGLRAGDLLVKAGNRRIARGADLGAALAGRSPGERIAITVVRSRLAAGAVIHEEVRVEATLAPRVEEGR